MFAALKKGARLLRAHKKAVFFAWLLNLLTAGLLFFPFLQTLDESLGRGLYRETMVETIDYDWQELFLDNSNRLASTFTPSVAGLGPFARNLEALLDGKLTALPLPIVLTAALYLLLNAFVTAAAVGSFAVDPQGTSFREFFRTGGEFLGRFFRLTILALLGFWLLRAVAAAPLERFVEAVTASASVDRTVFYWDLTRYAVVFGLMILLNMAFDYARIVAAVEDRTSVLLGFLSALTFCLAYLLPALALYLLIGAAAVGWAMLGVAMEQWIPQSSGFGVLAAFLAQQVYMVGRLGFRFYFYAAQMEFFLEREGLYRLEREPEQAPEPPSEPPALPVV